MMSAVVSEVVAFIQEDMQSLCKSRLSFVLLSESRFHTSSLPDESSFIQGVIKGLVIINVAS